MVTELSIVRIVHLILSISFRIIPQVNIGSRIVSQRNSIGHLLGSFLAFGQEETDFCINVKISQIIPIARPTFTTGNKRCTLVVSFPRSFIQSDSRLEQQCCILGNTILTTIRTVGQQSNSTIQVFQDETSYYITGLSFAGGNQYFIIIVKRFGDNREVTQRL